MKFHESTIPMRLLDESMYAMFFVFAERAHAMSRETEILPY